jgi:hypothetical protein
MMAKFQTGRYLTGQFGVFGRAFSARAIGGLNTWPDRIMAGPLSDSDSVYVCHFLIENYGIFQSRGV